jgi:hypothetical protein
VLLLRHAFGSVVFILIAKPTLLTSTSSLPWRRPLLNDQTLGGEATILYGPSYDKSYILQGNYTVELASRIRFHTNDPMELASIAQTGMIPINANSIEFLGKSVFGGPTLELSFNGQNIPTLPLSNGTNYTLYGGDISQFAGQTGELRFTSLPSPLYPTPQSGGLLDDISFSPMVIPEPSTLALMTFGLIFGLYRCRGFLYLYENHWNHLNRSCHGGFSRQLSEPRL